jgi:DNA-binding winged helix-turn-helix (wHTH) protein
VKTVESKEFLHFGLDASDQCLWRRHDSGDDERVSLTPKAFGVLQYLVQRAGRLVTQG